MPKRDFNKIAKQKELIMQLQIFHKHVEFTLLFPLRMSFPYQKSFLYFPEFFLR